METMEVEESGNAYLEILSYAGLIADLDFVIKAWAGREVVVYSVERIAEIEVASIFGSACIIVVIIWHQV